MPVDFHLLSRYNQIGIHARETKEHHKLQRGGQWPPKFMQDEERTEAMWEHAFMSQDLQKRIERGGSCKGKL